jgi:hypothetical protein
LLGQRAAVQGREIEPFMGFDEIDLDPASAGRISDAQFVERLDVAHRRGSHPAFDQEHAGFQAVTHFRAPRIRLGAVLARHLPTNG